MPEKVRVHVSLTPEERAHLRRRAEALGLNEEDLIVAAIRQVSSPVSSPSPVWDEDLWQDEIAFADSLPARSPHDSPTRRSREELYGERG